jgi:hypothetical protein
MGTPHGDVSRDQRSPGGFLPYPGDAGFMTNHTIGKRRLQARQIAVWMNCDFFVAVNDLQISKIMPRQKTKSVP